MAGLSLRTKWSLVLLLSGSFFLAGLAFFSYFRFSKVLQDEEAEDLAVAAQLVSQKLQRDFAVLQKELTIWVSKNPVLGDIFLRINAAAEGVTEEAFLSRMKSVDALWQRMTYEEAKTAYFDKEAQAYLEQLERFLSIPFLEIFLTDARGALVAANQKTTDYYQADEDWWQRAYGEGKGGFYHSGDDFDESSGVSSALIAVPVNRRGSVVGISKIVLNKDELLREAFRFYRSHADFMGIISADGTGIFSLSSGSGENQGYAEAVKDHIQRGSSRSGALVKTPDGRRFVCGYFKISSGLFGKGHVSYAYLLRDRNNIATPLREILGSLIFLWLWTTALFSLVVGYLVKKMVMPFGELRKGFSCLKRGILDYKISIKSGDEFEALADDFNVMIDDLRDNVVSKNHFNQIIQNMSDILFVVDSQGAIDLVNRRACEALEYEERELYGMSAGRILAKKDRYVISWGLKGAIDEMALRDKKISLLSKSGREIEVYLGIRCLRDVGNNLIGLVCLAKDLAEIDKLTDALLRSNEDARKSKAELETSLRELVASRDIMLSVLEDTTESKMALEQVIKRLRDTQDQLIQAEKMVSLGQIAAGVAHEINNPLFVISGEAEMLVGEEGLSLSTKESVHCIREQVQRISEIIKRMLEFSRKKDLKFDPIYIDPLLEKSIELLKYQARVVGNIEIVREYSANSLRINGDVNQLTEVFLNLMINAVQAMTDKGGVLTIRSFSEIIKPQQFKFGSPLRSGDPVVGVQVKDTGIGMDEATQKKIFDPFFTTKDGGTGLGLPVCYGIIENHGGAILVESAPGAGTMFTVYLPMKKRATEGK